MAKFKINSDYCGHKIGKAGKYGIGFNEDFILDVADTIADARKKAATILKNTHKWMICIFNGSEDCATMVTNGNRFEYHDFKNGTYQYLYTSNTVKKM